MRFDAETDAGPAAAPWRRRLAAIAWPALVFAAVLGIAAIHYQGQTLARGPDQADVLLAIFNEASHAIAEEGPLAAMYTERVRAGESNWSNPNYHVLYPLYFNWAGADASPEATLDRLNFIIMLHLALLGAGAFVLARALGVRTALAVAVGLALPWFPAVRSAAGWPHIIAGMAWLPWLLAAQARLYAGGTWRATLPAACGLALAATLLVYAHPAQNLVFAACASGMAWMLMAAQVAAARDGKGARALATSSAWLAAAAAATFLATWPYLSEILAFHARSIRWLGEVGGHVVGNQPLPLEALRHHALDATGAGQLVAFELGAVIGNAYVGAAVLVAALAVLGRQLPPMPQVRFARALLACGLLALAACFSPLAPLLAALPLAGRVRELTWWSCLAVVVLLPLAALGLQALRMRAPPPLARDPWAWLAAIGLLLGLAATLATGAGHRMEAAIALLAAFAALAWCLRSRAAGLAGGALACALLLAASAWMPFKHGIRFARADAMLFHPDRVQAHVDAAALAVRLPDLDRYRFVLDGKLPNAQLLTNAWTLHGFRALHGGIGPAEYDKHRLLVRGSPAVSALYGVRWSLWPEADAGPGDLALRPGLVLRTHSAALPRLFAIRGGLQLSNDPVATLIELGDDTPLRAVAAPGDLPSGLDATAFAGSGSRAHCITMLRNARTLLEATLDCDAPVLLVLNEDPAARWQATLDGAPVPTFRVNGYQAAIAVMAGGRHDLRIERPARLFRRGPADVEDRTAHLAN